MLSAPAHLAASGLPDQAVQQASAPLSVPRQHNWSRMLVPTCGAGGVPDRRVADAPGCAVLARSARLVRPSLCAASCGPGSELAHRSYDVVGSVCRVAAWRLRCLLLVGSSQRRGRRTTTASARSRSTI